jgi:hypothetical protein
MKYFSLSFQNLRGITLPKSSPISFAEPDQNGLLRPLSTVIVGSNGNGKSMALESLTLPTLMSRMRRGVPDGYKNNSSIYTSINIELKVFADDTNRMLPSDGKPGKVTFYALASVASELTLTLSSGVHLCRRIREFGSISDKIVTIDGAWYYECDDIALEKRLIELSIANHPLGLIDDKPNDISTDEYVKKCRQTERFREIEIESTPNSVKSLVRRFLGTTMLINTDLNTYGIGLHLLESPKNLRADLASVFHFRLPTTTTSGRLNNLDKIAKDWRKVFQTGKDFSFENVTCNDDGTTDIVIRRNEENDEEPINIHFLSSGQNEVFTILAAILGCRLEHSVLLLDEPELHLSHDSARRFYRVLASYTDGCGGQLGNPRSGRNLQIIAVTHSPVNPFLALAHWDHNKAEYDINPSENGIADNHSNPKAETNRCRLVEVNLTGKILHVNDAIEEILLGQFVEASEHATNGGKLLMKIQKDGRVYRAKSEGVQ